MFKYTIKHILDHDVSLHNSKITKIYNFDWFPSLDDDVKQMDINPIQE
jgi:hypothetical protein